MPPALKSMVSVAYVHDIDTARSFYELLGFRERRTGQAETAAWVILFQDDYLILLATTRPHLEVPRLPLLFYFFYDDLDAALRRLESAGIEVARLGHAPHALGGEARVVDPDGNTILLGQRERTAAQPAGADERISRFSLLQEAAAAVAARGGAASGCEMIDQDGRLCGRTAEVRLADSAGTTVWACIGHADELLVTVPGAFVTDQSADGIGRFLARRGAADNPRRLQPS
jgi:predicted enzyme related to lactoylglutathione lyase